MCDCEKHQDSQAKCNCLCDEHKNFDLAKELAFQRYNEIRHLRTILHQVDRVLRENDV